jgi:hypothetical protein
MMRKISEAFSIPRVAYFHEYNYEGYKGWGFDFPVDQNGNPLNVNPASQANWDKCHNGEVDGRKVIDLGIRREEWDERHPSIGQCDCGRRHDMGHGDIYCDCGRIYNSGGQELAPVSQWGEETGESPADIARAFNGEGEDDIDH